MSEHLRAEDVLKEIENEYTKLVSEARETILKKLRLSDKAKRRGTVFLCLDNGRAYLSKPRNCKSYREVGLEEYISSVVEEEVKVWRTRLDGWRWLLTSCGEVLNKVATAFYATSRLLFFDGGSVSVIGIEKPIIVVSVSKCSKEVAAFLQKLRESPHDVEVFVGSSLDPVTPEKALEICQSLAANA